MLQGNSNKKSLQCKVFSDFEKSVNKLQILARLLLGFWLEILKILSRPTKLACLTLAFNNTLRGLGVFFGVLSYCFVSIELLSNHCPLPEIWNLSISGAFVMCIKTNFLFYFRLLHIGCCNLANNHILDYGFEGVKETIQYLNEHRIKWFGFGKNWEIAWKPRIVKLKSEARCDLKMAIFGLADHFVEWKADTGPGINYFDINNFQNAEQNFNRARWQEIEYIQDEIKKGIVYFFLCEWNYHHKRLTFMSKKYIP